MVNHNPGEILKKYWGYDAFRPLQQEIIESILNGRDTLALLPTGGGKSICFQVPALCSEGLCLVISPLIALMKDQVENLSRKGIPALSMHTGMTYRELVQTLKNAAYGNYKFLYCSPERLQSQLFLEFLPAMNISFVAVDEAHCISQWGYDFRPAYMGIAEIRKHKQDIPILALTASATPEVREDIMVQLRFSERNVFSSSFARPNLSYAVAEADSRISKLIDILKKVPGCGIVYCKSRKRTQEIAGLLQLEHISADFYHAGLPQESRNARQEAWIQNKTRIMVCTNAFGMGIDKPDVRIVVHADCPDSMEHYYQEAGRAGRDGMKSYAVLLKSPLQVAELKALPDIRYPPMPVIRKVYQALGDYLQIPAGTGEDQYYDFDFSEFTRRFKLSAFEALYALQALEQEGIIGMNEQVFLPSRIQVTASREELSDLEERHPGMGEIIRTILRTYGGVMDQPTAISEKQMARVLKTREEEVKKALLVLHEMGIVGYAPRKDCPQVRYLQHRVKADDLYIDLQKYTGRKKAFEHRIQGMVGYLEDRQHCRSWLICSYFGDEDAVPCGICDHCLQKKKLASADETYRMMENRIRELLSASSLTPKDLYIALEEFDERKVKNLIDHLAAERKITIREDGIVQWM